MENNVLILGANGRFGSQAATSFERAGWTVHKFDRQRDDLASAAIGMQVIVAAWNPLYPDWAAQVPKLHAQIRAVALQQNATVILPGNVYVFGPQAPLPWGTETRHDTQTPLGRIRQKMEADYHREGVRTILLRAGDFIDTKASGNWFDKILIAGLNKGKLTYPGRPDIPHAWAYLPDLTRAAVALAEQRDSLPRYADIPYAGYTLTGQEIAEALHRVTGQDIALRQMRWGPFRLLSPFSAMMKHLLELRYLWETAHFLDPAPLSQLLPDFTPTPIDTALTRATAYLRPQAQGQLVTP